MMNDYFNDEIIYQPDMESVKFNDKVLPVTAELMERAKEQIDCSSKLKNWLALENSDILKSNVLYAMLDGNLFYDKLCNRDREKLAHELFSMSQDLVNFDDTNRNYFKKFSEIIEHNIKSPKEFINNEEDIILDESLEEYFIYNANKFNNNEVKVTR